MGDVENTEFDLTDLPMTQYTHEADIHDNCMRNEVDRLISLGGQVITLSSDTKGLNGCPFPVINTSFDW